MMLVTFVIFCLVPDLKQVLKKSSMKAGVVKRLRRIGMMLHSALARLLSRSRRIRVIYLEDDQEISCYEEKNLGLTKCSASHLVVSMTDPQASNGL